MKQQDRDNLNKLINNSENGIFMEIFIAQALKHYAKLIKDQDTSDMSNNIISPDVWEACADEVLAKLE